jgi:hypothetical protein
MHKSQRTEWCLNPLSGAFLLEEPKALRQLFTASHQIEEGLGGSSEQSPIGR